MKKILESWEWWISFVWQRYSLDIWRKKKNVLSVSAISQWKRKWESNFGRKILSAWPVISFVRREIVCLNFPRWPKFAKYSRNGSNFAKYSQSESFWQKKRLQGSLKDRSNEVKCKEMHCWSYGSTISRFLRYWYTSIANISNIFDISINIQISYKYWYTTISDISFSISVSIYPNCF